MRGSRRCVSLGAYLSVPGEGCPGEGRVQVGLCSAPQCYSREPGQPSHNHSLLLRFDLRQKPAGLEIQDEAEEGKLVLNWYEKAF
jgi:hypothetical protein